MKLGPQFIFILLGLGLMLFSLKPILPSLNKPTYAPSTQFSANSNQCPNRNATGSYCQVATFYAIVNSQILNFSFFQIITSSLYFLIGHFVLILFPTRLFKPPIASL